MSSFVKKLMATGAALSIGISSFAVADYFNLNCCPQPVCCDPCASWCDNLSFNAAWLYWKASGDDFQYAVEKTRSVTSTTEAGDRFVSREKFHDVKCDWDSGFRIGVGLDFPCKGWGADVNWTHFDTSSSKKTHVEGETSPPINVAAGFPVFDEFSTGILDGGESADFKGAFKLRYNTVDIEFGKWCCCACVQFRPFTGFRAVDIKEKFKAFARANNGAAFAGDFPAACFHHENHFKGLGVRAGLDVDLCLCDGWSIIGRGAANAIWGTTHLKNKATLSTFDIVDRDTDFIKEDFRQVRFIADLRLGVRWRTMACGCYPLTLELAWEHHYLFNQHRYWVDDHFSDFDTTSSWRSTGDVALQGLTLSVGFDY